MANINTVLGSVESSKLGFTLSHEHICNGFGGSPFTFPEFLDRTATLERAINDLSEAKKEGLDTAHKYAFNFAKDKGYDYFITLDADLSHDPKILPDFIKNLKKHPFVIGSRYVKNGKNETKFFRFLLSFMGNKFIKFVSGIKCSEFTTSYRGFNLIELKNVDLNEVSARGYSFFMETIFLIQRNNYEIKEIPIIFRDRTKGASKIPKTEILRTLLNLFLLKIKNKKTN